MKNSGHSIHQFEPDVINNMDVRLEDAVKVKQLYIGKMCYN